MTKERDLILTFIRQGLLRGRYWLERTISQINGESKYNAVNSLRVDAFVKTQEGDTWILEVKEKLNMEALGQILTYDFLTHRKHKLGVVVREGDDRLTDVFRHYNIQIFEV